LRRNRRRNRPRNLQNTALRLDRRNPSVTPAGQCFDVTWLIRRVTECLPQLVHGCIQTVFEIAAYRSRPQQTLELVSPNDAVGMIQEIAQKLRGLSMKPHPNAVLPQLSGGGVEFERTELKLGRGKRLGTHRHLQESMIPSSLLQ
jgi:hypothetical protein